MKISLPSLSWKRKNLPPDPGAASDVWSEATAVSSATSCEVPSDPFQVDFGRWLLSRLCSRPASSSRVAPSSVWLTGWLGSSPRKGRSTSTSTATKACGPALLLDVEERARLGRGAHGQDRETLTAVRRRAVQASPALILLNEAYGRQLDNCLSPSRCSGVSTASIRVRASSRAASISRRKAIISS